MKRNHSLPVVDIHALRTKSLKGLTLLVGREIVIKIVAAIGQLLLVRLLSPEFFGVFAVITFLINAADLFTDLGLISGVIREREEPSPDTLSVIFTLKSLLTGIAVVVLNTLATVLMMKFVHSEAYLVAFRIMTLTLLLRPYKTIVYGLLERELRYENIPMIDVGGLLVYFVVAILLSGLHMGFWSLVLAVVAKDSTELVMLYCIRSWIPNLQFSFRKLRSYIHFGAPLQLATIVGFIHQSSIPFLGGLLSTPASVGILDTSYNIASMPRALTDNVGRVAFASFSRIQNETDLLSRASTRAISVLTLPLLLLLSLSLSLGQSLVGIILTPKWLGILAPLNWYLVAGIFLSCIAVLQQAIIARGETLWLLRLSTITVIGEWVLSIALFHYIGFVAFAVASAISALLLFLQYVVLGSYKGIRVNLVRSLLPNFLIFTLLMVASTLLSRIGFSPYAVIPLKLVTLLTLFVVFTFVFARDSFHWVISLIREFIFL